VTSKPARVANIYAQIHGRFSGNVGMVGYCGFQQSTCNIQLQQH